MANNKMRVLVNSIMYTFSSILIKAGGFLLLPIYTSFLTPDDYGATNLITSFTNVAAIIVMFSLHSSITRFYTDYKENWDKLKRFFGSIINFSLLNASVLIIISFFLKDFLIDLLFNGISFFPIIVLSIITLLFSVQHTIHQTIMISMQEGKKYTKSNLLFFLFETILTLIFIVFFKMGLLGVVLAKFISNSGYFIYMIIDLLKNNLIFFCFDFAILKEALKYSIPIIPHNLSTNIATWFSRLLLNEKGSLSIVGLYSVASQFGNIIDVVQSSVNTALTPWLFELMSNEDEKSRHEIVGFSEILLIGYSLIYMGIGLFSQEAILIMTGKEYAEAWVTIPILVMGYSAKSIYYFYINILFYHKKAANKIFIATISGSLVDVILAYILIPKLAMYGSAIAFLVAKVIVVIIVVLLSKRYDDIGYKVSSMLKIIVPSLVFMFIGLLFSYTKYTTSLSLHNVVYKCLIFLLYLIYLVLTNKEVNSLLKSIKDRK